MSDGRRAWNFSTRYWTATSGARVSPQVKISTAAYPCSGQVWTETWDSAITTMPLMPKGLNWWKWVPTMVAFAILAAATKISSTLFTSFRSLGLQPFNSSTKCRPSACNSFAPFRCGLYREWPTYRLSHLPLRETTGKAHDTRKLCVNIAELFQLSINFFRGPPCPPSRLPVLYPRHLFLLLLLRPHGSIFGPLHRLPPFANAN